MHGNHRCGQILWNFIARPQLFFRSSCARHDAPPLSTGTRYPAVISHRRSHYLRPGETDQDRREGRQPRSLCRLSDGRGRHPTADAPGDFTADCRTTRQHLKSALQEGRKSANIHASSGATREITAYSAGGVVSIHPGTTCANFARPSGHDLRLVRDQPRLVNSNGPRVSHSRWKRRNNCARWKDMGLGRILGLGGRRSSWRRRWCWAIYFSYCDARRRFIMDHRSGVNRRWKWPYMWFRRRCALALV